MANRFSYSGSLGYIQPEYLELEIVVVHLRVTRECWRKRVLW